MTYTNNVPQANQTIAATQAPILANFAFIPLSIGQEHNFDSTAANKTYHLKASMPNLSGGDPVSLPSGTNGMYYILGGNPKFYDGTTASFIALSGGAAQNVLTGTVTINNSSTANLVSVPANSCGTYYVYQTSPTFSPVKVNVGQFFSSSTLVNARTNNSTGMSVFGLGLTLGALLIPGSPSPPISGSFIYVIQVFTP